MIRRAQCCCGECVVEVEGDPVMNGICHCDDCKRRTGSAFGWSSYFRDDQVKRCSGKAQTYKVVATAAERFFCVRCGSTLYWRSDTFMAGHLGVSGGSFVQSPLPEPAFASAYSQRCAWMEAPAHWHTAG